MVEVQDLTQGSRYRPRFELQRRYALVTSHGTYSFIGGLPGLSPASGLSQRFSAFRRSADAEFPSPEHVWKIGVLGLLGIAAGCGLIYMAWRRAHVVSFEVDPVRQVLLVIVRSPEGEAKFQMSTARSMSLTKGHVLSEIWLGISQDGVVHSLMPVGIGETGGKSQRAAIQAFLAAHEATCL
jgi:hypothetical protein